MIRMCVYFFFAVSTGLLSFHYIKQEGMFTIAMFALFFSIVSTALLFKETLYDHPNRKRRF